MMTIRQLQIVPATEDLQASLLLAESFYTLYKCRNLLALQTNNLSVRHELAFLFAYA